MNNVYAAFDVGGTFLKYGLISEEGILIKESRIPTSPNWEEFVKSISYVIENIDFNILGIGISCPGTVDITTGTVYDGGLLPYLDNVNLKQYVESKFKLPSKVTNDGKAAIMAEVWQGHLRNVSNGSAIVLGSGVAGSIVLNGKLLEGSHFRAGEYSFISNLKSGEFSEDNLVGLDASAVRFIRNCAEILDLEDLHDGKAVFEAIKIGQNEQINSLFNEYCMIVAHLIMNLQAILDLDKIVIGGGISKQDILIDNITKQYRALRSAVPIYSEKFSEVTIEACKFGNSSNLLGAVYPFFENI